MSYDLCCLGYNGIGLLFARKSDLTLASTSFVTSMILMIAHWNWMDPSMNLVPVLIAIG